MNCRPGARAGGPAPAIRRETIFDSVGTDLPDRNVAAGQEGFVGAPRTAIADPEIPVPCDL